MRALTPIRLLALLALLALAPACGGRDEGGRSDKDTTEPGEVSPDVDPDGVTLPDGAEPDDETVGVDTIGDTTRPDGNGDTDTVLPPQECEVLPPLETGTCAVTPGNASLLLKGRVLGADRVYEGGQVLIDAQGAITCVACDCSGEAAAQGATVVTCPAGVISPAPINAHEHLTFGQNAPGDWGDERYEHRHDWRKGKNGHTKVSVAGGASKANISWCEMRHLLSGVVTIAGSGSADGFLRNIDGSGNQEGLGQGDVDYRTFPLGDSNGQQIAQGCAYPNIDALSKLGADCYHAHVAEGINAFARNEFLCLSSDENGGRDFTEPNASFVHCVGLTAIDGAELAANQTSVIWSPRSNVSLYGNTAPVTMYANEGVLIGLGSDWSASGSMNMQRELACAAYLNDVHYGGFFTNRDLWAMATGNNATLLALDDAIGALAVGLVADIAIYTSAGTGDPYRALIDAGAGDTVLVMRGGEPLYGDLDVVSELPGGDTGCEPIPGGVCDVPKSICVERETGWTFSEIAGQNTDDYDLFFCGTPAGEPSCVPFRPGEYTGVPSTEDPDGDGVPGAADNCPTIFNPIRPVDEGKQGDLDGDGVGDVCDPCPLDADTTACSVPNPDDKDGDGVPNSSDLCPLIPDPGQEDTDGDGKGDACDACPQAPNPGSAACPATIPDVKQGVVPAGTRVRVEGVVSAAAERRVWLQVPADERDAELGPRFSGLLLYDTKLGGALDLPARGDRLTVEGTIDVYYDQIELVDLALTKLSSGPAPEPEVVPAATVGTAGADHAAWDGLLVTVIDATVTSISPTPQCSESAPLNEYVLDDALRVNDLLYKTSPFPVVNESLTVTGVLHFANCDAKLEPRDEGDIARALGLASFGPSPVYVYTAQIEAQTLPPLTITLTRPAPAEGATLTLISANEALLAVPATLTIPAGERTATVAVDALGVSEGAIEVSASFEGKTMKAQVFVIDPARVPAPVAWEPAALDLFVGASGTARVLLDIPAQPGGTVVELVNLATGVSVVDFPDGITVPAGELDADVVVDALAEGAATLTASTATGSADLEIAITSMPLVGLVLSELMYNTPGDDTNQEWVEIYNGTGAALDLAGYSLGWGDTNWAYGVMGLSGTLEAGACAVIGGPSANAGNGNPTYFLAKDFDPDIQNAGGTADGVALFDKAAGSVGPATVPIDVVLYDGSNGSKLIDETGGVASVDIATAVPAGQTAERQGEVWKVQPTPTPGDCAKVLLAP